MKKLVSFALILVLLLSVGFAGCNNSAQVVNVYNWGEYINEDVLDEFEEQTGIEVNYRTFETNEQLYSLLKNGVAEYDVIIPSDYMVARMIEEGMLEELNFDNIPNFSNMDPAYTHMEYDPDNLYTVPYMWGTVGLIYNKTVVTEPVDSWGLLFDEQYSGQILMFDNPRDAFAIALLYLGYSINTTDENELNEAYELLVQQKPIIQSYVMDQIFDKLQNGEAAIGPYYAGDYISMNDVNPDLEFVIPKEGSNFFIDCMCIPKGAENKGNAEAFINFMCETSTCLANCEEIGYSTPSKRALESMDEDMRNNSVMYP